MLKVFCSYLILHFNIKIPICWQHTDLFFFVLKHYFSIYITIDYKVIFILRRAELFVQACTVYHHLGIIGGSLLAANDLIQSAKDSQCFKRPNFLLGLFQVRLTKKGDLSSVACYVLLLLKTNSLAC